jgi:hypothetical protein
MARRLVLPLAWISRTIGSTLRANSSAAARFAALPRAEASAKLVRLSQRSNAPAPMATALTFAVTGGVAVFRGVGDPQEISR